MKKIYLQLLILHAFIGVGALFGGLGVLIDPSGKSMGVSPDILKKGPFDNFLIPGIILFVFIGIGNLFTSILAYKKHKLQAYFSGVLSCGLVIWIVVQCYMLDIVTVLHVIYFLLGVYGIILASLLAFKQHIFPLNLIIRRNNNDDKDKKNS